MEEKRIYLDRREGRSKQKKQRKKEKLKRRD
jgi:hypothetical protein